MRDERQMVFPWFDQAVPKDLSLQELKRQVLKAKRKHRELVKAVMELPDSLRAVRRD